jgi:hypothetical protein
MTSVASVSTDSSLPSVAQQSKKLTQDRVKDIIYELSLASAFPVGVHGVDMFRATSSANLFASFTKNMSQKELKGFVFAIGPLIGLMCTDIDHPLSAKAASGIASLLKSRVCMNYFLEIDGLR